MCVSADSLSCLASVHLLERNIQTADVTSKFFFWREHTNRCSISKNAEVSSQTHSKHQLSPAVIYTIWLLSQQVICIHTQGSVVKNWVLLGWQVVDANKNIHGSLSQIATRKWLSLKNSIKDSWELFCKTPMSWLWKLIFIWDSLGIKRIMMPLWLLQYYGILST